MQPVDLFERIQESAQWLVAQGIGKVDAGMILGSGMGDVIKDVERLITVKFTEVPHLAGAAVTSHKGELIYANWGGKRVLIFAGRIHYYEGYEMWQVAYPVRLIKALGGEIFITTGAVGGINPAYETGDIVVLRDHISLMPENPLRGKQDPRLGLRFPDMSAPYDAELAMVTSDTAAEHGLELRSGVYAGLPGPSLETKAEYQYLHTIGADIVGMSVVPEVVVAVQSELRIIGLCVVSNLCYPPHRVAETTIENVVEIVRNSAQDLAIILESTFGVMEDSK